MEAYKALITIFGTSISLLGVFLIFRLNGLSSNLRDNFDRLEKSLKSLESRGYRLSGYSRNEIIETLFGWLQNKEDKGREYVYQVAFSSVNQIADDIQQRIDQVKWFKRLVCVLGIAICGLLYKLSAFHSDIQSEAVIQVVVYIIFVLLICSVVLFVISTMPKDNDYWGTKCTEWAKIKELFPGK